MKFFDIFLVLVGLCLQMILLEEMARTLIIFCESDPQRKFKANHNVLTVKLMNFLNDSLPDIKKLFKTF